MLLAAVLGAIVVAGWVAFWAIYPRFARRSARGRHTWLG
jgi:hypothetical protein